MKEPITPEIEREIRDLCRASVRGQYVDVRRIAKLYRKYSKEWGRIADEEKKKATREINPLADAPAGKETVRE